MSPDGFGQDVIQRRQDITAGGMMAVGELLGLGLVAARTIARRDNGGDQRPVVIVGVRVALFRLMAFHTADTFGGVGAADPVVDNAPRLVAVAIDTLFRTAGDGDMSRGQAGLLAAAGYLQPLDQQQG